MLYIVRGIDTRHKLEPQRYLYSKKLHTKQQSERVMFKHIISSQPTHYMHFPIIRVLRSSNTQGHLLRRFPSRLDAAISQLERLAKTNARKYSNARRLFYFGIGDRGRLNPYHYQEYSRDDLKLREHARHPCIACSKIQLAPFATVNAPRFSQHTSQR